MKEIFLTPLSLLYKSISFLNLKFRSFRKHEQRDLFIISIDNISFGGTGKTTAVLKIAKDLLKRDMKVSIVLRGYGSKFSKGSRLVESYHTLEEVGDEALIYRSELPEADLFIGNDRIASIQKCSDNGTEVVLLDDGFQTVNIKKDLKIMLINPDQKYYYLRNFKFMTSEEDIVLFYSPYGKVIKENFGFKVKESAIVGAYDFIKEGLIDIGGNRVEPGNIKIVGFSGVGDNERFRRDLMGFQLVEFISYRDHFKYTDTDIEKLNGIRKDKNCDFLVCTFKDFVKLSPDKLKDIPLIYLKNRIKFVPDIVKIILKRINEKKNKI